MESSGALLDMPRPKKLKSVGGRPKATEPKKPIASFRGTEEFAAWFDGLADHVRLPASVLIEHALIEYAKKIGYKNDPPAR